MRKRFSDILAAVNDLEMENDPISKTYRIGKPIPGKFRLSCIAFCNEATKGKVLYKARELRNKPEHKNIYINPDRSRIQQAEVKARSAKRAEKKTKKCCPEQSSIEK